MNINIKDVINYFYSIDSIERNGKLSLEECQKAIKTNSIFSSVLSENMTFEQFCTTFVNKYRNIIDNGNNNEGKNLPYKMENFPEAQSWTWSAITRVLTKEEINQAPFDIKTPEGKQISPTIKFNTKDGLYMLKHLSFDEEAFKYFPKENLPEGWNPQRIFELGKDPGMNVRKMNEMGYTGKNITVAIIDTPIIMHNDIKSSLVGYEVMNNSLASNLPADYHGQAVADILCGDNTGVAPDSNLVYFAKQDNLNDGLQALRRILEINKNAEENNQPENKIRVVSLSWGFNEGMEGYDEFRSLLKELYDNGVFVVTADFNMLDESITGAKFATGILDKEDQQGEPNDFTNYKPELDMYGYPNSTLFVVAGDKTVASAANPNSLRHDSKGSTSWSRPVLAGIYACALQCADEHNIQLTPKIFWDYAYKTGQDMYENGEFVGKAIDAEALINAMLEDKNANQTNFGI